MSYDYIRRFYGVDPQVGDRVRHTVTGKLGRVAREEAGRGHYVMVRFDDRRFNLPCHPLELEFLPPEAVEAAA